MYLLKSAITLILFLTLVSCNDDVFVDRPEEIGDDTVVMLGGNSASAELAYSAKNLKAIMLSHNGNCPISVYASDGSLITEVAGNRYDVTGPCQLAMRNDFVSMWVMLDRQGIVSAFVDFNAYACNFTAELTFDYGKSQRKAYFVVEPGSRYNLTDIRYDFNSVVRESASQKVRLPVIENGSDKTLPLTLSLSSYIPDYFRFEFGDDYAAMLDASRPDLAPVPTLDSAGKIGLYGTGAMFVNKETQTADSNLSGAIIAEVPPKSRLVITVDVKYVNLTVPFVAEITNADGHFVTFDGLVRVGLSRDYDVDIKEEKL